MKIFRGHALNRGGGTMKFSINFWRGHAHLSTFEFGGHANLGCLTLLDIKTSLDGPIHLQGGLSMEICCINVQQSLQICLQSSKIRPPNSNVDKCASQFLYHPNCAVLSMWKRQVLIINGQKIKDNDEKQAPTTIDDYAIYFESIKIPLQSVSIS